MPKKCLKNDQKIDQKNGQKKCQKNCPKKKRYSPTRLFNKIE